MKKLTKLDKLTRKVGRQLYSMTVDIEDLEHDIDYGPELDQDGMESLRMLTQARNLVRVAFEIYPYSVG